MGHHHVPQKDGHLPRCFFVLKDHGRIHVRVELEEDIRIHVQSDGVRGDGLDSGQVLCLKLFVFLVFLLLLLLVFLFLFPFFLLSFISFRF